MRKSLALLALTAAMSLPVAAQADRAWMFPSSTSLSGTEEWITIDAGISDNLFVADHATMRLDGLVVTRPDGSPLSPANVSQGRYRSTFDVHLTQPGTYKIANLMGSLIATYTLNGEEKRWRGPAADYPAALPAGAVVTRATTNAHRIETFVTLNAPTETVFTPTGRGLEMVPVTHPSDAVVGEAATFALMHDGRPAAGLRVIVGRGGARYRDALEDIETVTDDAGRFTVTWPEPGLYWMNAAVRTEPAGDTPDTNIQYSGVLEVLP